MFLVLGIVMSSLLGCLMCWFWWMWMEVLGKFCVWRYVFVEVVVEFVVGFLVMCFIGNRFFVLRLVGFFL